MGLKHLSVMLFVGALTCSSAAAAGVKETAVASDFPAKAYTGLKRMPDFRVRDRDYVSYRTRIRNGISDGPNFSGRFALVQFGCGTECRAAFVADVRSGQVFDFPLGGEDYRRLHLDFAVGSRLVSARWLRDDRCVQQKLVWTGQGFDQSAVADLGDEETCNALERAEFQRHLSSNEKTLPAAPELPAWKPRTDYPPSKPIQWSKPGGDRIVPNPLSQLNANDGSSPRAPSTKADAAELEMRA